MEEFASEGLVYFAREASDMELRVRAVSLASCDHQKQALRKANSEEGCPFCPNCHT
jgi:hypothetical protein